MYVVIDVTTELKIFSCLWTIYHCLYEKIQLAAVVVNFLQSSFFTLQEARSFSGASLTSIAFKKNWTHFHSILGG